jgi:hypothetical protein
MVGPLSLWFLVNNSRQSSILLLYLFWRHDTSSCKHPLSDQSSLSALHQGTGANRIPSKVRTFI